MPFALALLSMLLAADPLVGVPQDGAGATVRRAIAHHGGFDTWLRKTTVQFRKTTTRFGPDGKVERRPTQLHRYRLHPGFAARVEWEEGGHQIVLINDGRRTVKLVDGKPATAVDDVNQSRNATFGSHYVFSMPFKLADTGAQLSAAKQRKLPEGSLVDGVRVTYAPGAGDAAGTHTWTYFFDALSGRLTANHLTYGPGQHDYTEYHDDMVVDGITIARRRLGFGADESGRKGSRTSEILYEDVKFDVPLESGLFVVPLPPG